MAEVKIGDQRFSIKPLTFGQLQEILPLFAEAKDAANREIIENRFRIVAAALIEDHPDMTVDALRKIRSADGEGLADIHAAVATIAELSGLVPKGEDRAGTLLQ